MGSVYLARQISLNRPVALKLIRSGRLATESEVRRFKIEAEAAGNLDHPNIVPLYEVGEWDGQPYLSMRLVEGGSLAEWIARRGRVSPRQAASLTSILARAVHHAHQRGILHRDLKPTNVLIDNEGTPYLTDFGLAKWMTRNEDLTQTLALVGTPHYMAPEQAGVSGHALTTACDVYGLGAILYELLTGGPPFQGGSALEVLQEIRHASPKPLRRSQDGVDRDLETICLKCLEKRPADRYASAADLAEDLEHWLAARPIRARPTSVVQRSWKWARRNPTVAALATLAHVLLVAGVAGVAWQWRQAEGEREANRLRLVRLNVANGIAALEKRDGIGALPWLVEALRLDSDDPRAAETHRLRIGLALQEVPRLERLWEHAGAVNHVEFNHDGSRVVSASSDGTAKVWTVDSDDSRCVLKHRGRVHHALFSPDGKWIATASADGEPRLWDADTGAYLGPPMRHEGPVLRVCFSPDQSRLVSASEDATARVWDTGEGHALLHALRHDGMVRDVAFSPDGALIASFNARPFSFDKEESSPKLWDSQTGDLRGRIPYFGGAMVYRILFSPQGDTLLAAGYSSVGTIDVQSQKPLTHFVGTVSMNSAAFTSDGEYFGVASNDGNARFFSSRGPRWVGPPLVHPSGVNDVGFSPDDTMAITACQDGLARIWNWRRGGEVYSALRHAGGVTRAVFSPDGKRMVTASMDGLVRLWRLPDEMPAREIRNLPGQLTRLLVTKKSNYIVTMTYSGALQIWKLPEVLPVGATFATGGSAGDIALSPDGTRLVCGGQNRRVTVLDLATGSERVSFELQRPIANVAFSKDGRRILTATGKEVYYEHYLRTLHAVDGPIEVRSWEADTGKALTAPIAFPGTGRIARFSADGDKIYVGRGDTSVEIHDLHTGRLLGVLAGVGTGPEVSELDETGRYLATASHFQITEKGQSEIGVWDLRSGELVVPPVTHEVGAYSVTFSPDSRWVLSTGQDGLAQAVALGDSRARRIFRHPGYVFDAAFTPDGRWMATGCLDGRARIWDFHTGELIGELRHPAQSAITRFLNNDRLIVGLWDNLNQPSPPPHEFHLWQLPLLEAPIDELIRLTELLCAARVDQAGSLVPVDAAAVRAAWASRPQSIAVRPR